MIIKRIKHCNVQTVERAPVSVYSGWLRHWMTPNRRALPVASFFITSRSGMRDQAGVLASVRPSLIDAESC